jgi:Flp pilus assembly protein TadD
LELLKEAHTRAPEDAQVSHLLGRLAFQQGDHKWASSLLEESFRKLPNDPEVLFDLAWSRYSLGRVAEAETAMTAAAKAGAAFTRADEAKRFLDLLAASKDPALAERAVAEVQKILSAAPDYVPALMVSALVQEQHRSYQEAGRLYDRILARYPLFAPAGRNLAILCAEQLGDDQKAYALAAKAREAFPQDADLAKTLGALAYRRGDYARSAQLLKETALKRNNDAELFYYLGMAHYRLKESKEGKAALQRALSLNLKPQLADETRRVLAQLK